MQARQLTRSETNRRLAGVCGGIGEYFGIDPVLIRVGFVVAGLMGWGVLLYVVLWIVLPKGQPTPGAVAAAGGRSAPAVRIAEERYARGEISAEELHQIRGDLTRGS
ncbi:MAG TPA: PspC domain-containing protein [Actinomycetota bacterium]|jgi:phage shock protein PspC (stress-responsive transcriptional regulator)